MDALQYLKTFYETINEDARLSGRAGSVEFLTTMRYIEEYLTPGMRIVEIGAGTGRYSHALAQRGYSVDALELIEHNIDVFRQHTLPDEPVTITQGNALALPYPDDCYDITLLLGPMYHLYTEEDQKQAMREAIRVTKPGGVIFAAYCGNDATMVQFCFRRGKIREPRYQELIDPITFKCRSTPEEVIVLWRKEEVDALMSAFPVQRLHYVGTDMATEYMEDVVNAMDDETFEIYLRYHFSICERSDMVGVSHHSLDVFRKQ